MRCLSPNPEYRRDHYQYELGWLNGYFDYNQVLLVLDNFSIFIADSGIKFQEIQTINCNAAKGNWWIWLHTQDPIDPKNLEDLVLYCKLVGN